tara:strand:- start:730 stop:1491 length:762 start_codon:yes stop_codon:yes gene_type:complete
MLPLGSSRIFFRSSNWFFLLILIYFLLVSGLPVEAQAPTRIDKLVKKNATSSTETGKTLFESLKKNRWADIKGFRSAKFGMNEKSVYRAIATDFKLAKSKVKKTTDAKEHTTGLEIIVPDLFSTGGTAKVGYILGYKSKKLIHINVLWGRGAAEKVDGKDVLTTANLLRTHFLKKRYKEEGLVANGKLSNTSTVVFRGKDKKNRMILLMLGTQLKEEGMTDEQIINSTSLVLSYILNPDEPDVRKIVIQEDEF